MAPDVAEALAKLGGREHRVRAQRMEQCDEPA
jgi:hypothetical protein